LIMEALDIGAAPGSDEVLSDISAWDDSAVGRLVTAIEAQFRVRLHPSSVNCAKRVADLAIVVDHARRMRTGSDRA